MLPEKNGPAALQTRTDPDTKINDDDDKSYIARTQQKQETIAALRRDFVSEALRIVAVKASHAADDVDLGDDLCAERGIALVISHLKAAAATFRKMQRGSK